jgi:hypothetical protein
MYWSPDVEKREACERVRMENAAKRNKTLPKVYRRVMAAAAEAKAKEAPSSSVRTITEVSPVDGLDELDMIVEVDSETETEKVEVVSPLPAASKSTPKPGHYHEVTTKIAQQPKRQTKSCTGQKPIIDEGVSLASDEDGDVARLHAANRKAWPRGKEAIAADGTLEDREIAELVRRGFIGAEDLQVDHDDFGEDQWCPYTVRFMEPRKKGRRGDNRRQQEAQVVAPAPLDPESDWWYLDDKAYAQLLVDGGFELVDWSEASSFVHVE